MYRTSHLPRGIMLSVIPKRTRHVVLAMPAEDEESRKRTVFEVCHYTSQYALGKLDRFLCFQIDRSQVFIPSSTRPSDIAPALFVCRSDNIETWVGELS